MKLFFLFILICFGSSYFIGGSPFPWTSSSQDLLWFLGLILFFILFYKKQLNIPKITFPIVFICLIPLIQFIFGQIYYFSTALFSFCFMLGFLVSILYGYNCTQVAEKNNIITCVAYFFIIIGFISAIFAIAQWFQISHPYILNLNHNRPYANLGQPNHLATLLMLSICSIFFIYEHCNYKWIYCITLLSFDILALALTQSRTSWVILILLLMTYFLKKISFKKKSTSYMVYFTFFSYILIFIFNSEISKYLNLVAPIPMGDRLNGGFARVEMWRHMLYAIMQHPWFGYGWFQTTIAQLEGVLIFKNEGYLSSAHNIIIDLVLWVGIPLGLLISLYCLYLIKLIYFNIKTLSELYIFMMILCMVVHAHLEYPLYYSYFLFPLGFFIGMSLINCNSKDYFVHEKLKQIIFLISICFYALVFKQYDQWLSKLGFALGMENTGQSQYKKSILFSQFADQAEFIVAEIDKSYTQDELGFFEYYVVSQPSYYNLFKMAQIFYFNKNMVKANYYFEVSNMLYNKKTSFEDLSKLNISQNNNISLLFSKYNNDTSNLKAK